VIPTLHVVTDDEILRREGFIPMAIQVLEAGRTGIALHLRGPGTHGRVLEELAGSLAGPAGETGSRLLVNDRVDLALALDLSGAHLGQRSLQASVARSILGPDRLLGLSVHGQDELDRAAEAALDFLVVGTIFSTPSHAGRVPAGLKMVREMVEFTDLPVLAIGGMDRTRVRSVLDAGAHGMAVRGGIWDAVDPGAAVGGYLDALKE